ncbi:MAG: hypothetical protein NWE87_02920 [Candidatus Bathyarchaeota archaeon]|nr:hypothetical protein [Candidatus Bathyarchaeota archaeon]
MMDKDRRIFIDGDINDEIVGHVANLLREHQINADIELGDLTKAAHLIPTPDILAAAASIAAVLSFLLNFWQIRRKSRKSNIKKPSNINEVSLEYQLQLFGAEGFEVDSIKGINKTNLERADKISITLNDVPGKQIVIVEMGNDYRVKIQRNKF